MITNKIKTIKTLKEFKLPEVIDLKAKYIICPDITCNGFFELYCQCFLRNTAIELFPERNYKLCPNLDKAKLVVFCAYGHAIEEVVNCLHWTRSDCKELNCNSLTFSKMSETTYRIPLEKYEEFLKLKIIK